MTVRPSAYVGERSDMRSAQPRLMPHTASAGYTVASVTLPLQPAFAHHQLGVLQRIQRGALPKIVAADPEREAVIQARYRSGYGRRRTSPCARNRAASGTTALPDRRPAAAPRKGRDRRPRRFDTHRSLEFRVHRNRMRPHHGHAHTVVAETLRFGRPMIFRLSCIILVSSPV